MSLSASIWGLARLLVATGVSTLPSLGHTVQVNPVAEPDPAAIYIERGVSLLGRKDSAGAKFQFSAALGVNPRSVGALTWRGIAENQLKQYVEAEKDFKSALRIDSENVPAHYNLALSLVRTGQSDSAIEQLEFVVRAQPGVLEPEYNLALLLDKKHATKEAIEHFKAAYKSSPNDIGVTQHLLVDLLATGAQDEVQPILQRVQNSDSVEAKWQVGTALIEAGDYQQAVAMLEGARALTQSSHQVDLLLARAYIGAQEGVKAIDLLKPVEMLDNTGETAYLLGLAYSDAGAGAEARDAFEFAVRKNPQHGRALYHLGTIESRDPDLLTTAITHLTEAARLEPDNSFYGIELGKLLLQEDEARKALAAIRRVHTQGPEAGERDLLLGIAQIIVDGPKQAEPTLERAVEENRSLALSNNMLGFCLLALGDISKAAASYGKASDLDPGNRIFAHGAAAAFDRSNDNDRAMIYARRAVALPGANGEDHYLVGKLLNKTNQPGEAIREFSQAIALSPGMEEAYYLLARAYMQTGDTTQATNWIARLKDLKQKHDHVAGAARKNIKPMTSSTLLQGAPVTSAESGTP